MDAYTDYDGSIDQEPKTRFGKIIRAIFLSISIFLYAVIFLRFFVSCDSNLASVVLLDRDLKNDRDETILGLPRHYDYIYNVAKSRNKSVDFSVLRYDITTARDKDGRIQIKYVTYLKRSEALQLTVKFNTDYHPLDSNGKIPYKFVIMTSVKEKTVYTPADFIFEESRFSYHYARMCFKDLKKEVGSEFFLMIYKDGTDDFYNASPIFSLKVVGDDIYFATENLSNVDFVLV